MKPLAPATSAVWQTKKVLLVLSQYSLSFGQTKTFDVFIMFVCLIQDLKVTCLTTFIKGKKLFMFFPLPLYIVNNGSFLATIYTDNLSFKVNYRFHA